MNTTTIEGRIQEEKKIINKLELSRILREALIEDNKRLVKIMQGR
jgi:hypothetical protein